jgi:hypothetical protein
MTHRFVSECIRNKFWFLKPKVLLYFWHQFDKSDVFWLFVLYDMYGGTSHVTGIGWHFCWRYWCLESTQPLKMSTRNFSWCKGGRCVRLTTYHSRSAERQENPGLHLPGTPRATSACCVRHLPFYWCLEVSTNTVVPATSLYTFFDMMTISHTL